MVFVGFRPAVLLSSWTRAMESLTPPIALKFWQSTAFSDLNAGSHRFAVSRYLSTPYIWPPRACIDTFGMGECEQRFVSPLSNSELQFYLSNLKVGYKQ